MSRYDGADCGVQNDHTPLWFSSMTSPTGETGIEIRLCTPCVVLLLASPAVQVNGRTVHLKKMEG